MLLIIYFYLTFNIMAKNTIQYIKNLKIALFLLWPDLEGSRYDIKMSTRVPLASERPKDPFSFFFLQLYLN